MDLQTCKKMVKMLSISEKEQLVKWTLGEVANKTKKDLIKDARAFINKKYDNNFKIKKT